MALLPEDEVASLRELEHRYAENMEYASRFSFKCGMLITDVECAWENHVHNAGLLGFYIGYRAGFDLMDEVRPLSRMECISKIMTMEFALGFIQPLKEQENRQVA